MNIPSLRIAFLVIAISNAQAFTVPAGMDTDEFLLQNLLTPANTDPLFDSDLLKKSLTLLHSYQQSVEGCIKVLGTPQGCNTGQQGIPNKMPIQNDLESSSVTIKNGVITLYPSANKDVPPKISGTIVATPAYNNGNITWDYSGSLFDYDKMKYLKIHTTETLYCPDPATFPSSFKRYHSFVDLKGIKYVIGGNKAVTENDEAISFLWAAYPTKDEKKVACVYKIGDDPFLQDNWFSLITEDEVAEAPQEGLWNSVKMGICPTTNTLAASSKVSDCPFKLKISAVKNKRRGGNGQSF